MTEKIHILGENDVPGVADVLTESFADYPVMRFIIGRDTRHYEQKLRVLMRFFAMARVLRGEVLLGIGHRADPDGAALVSRPQNASPPALDELRERVWADLGAPARARYEAIGAVTARFHVEVPHLHLNVVGVRRRAQGKGLGRALIEQVHLLSRNDPESYGVTLTTEDPRNVPFYKRLGYEVVAHAAVAPELESWGFFRAD